MCRAVAPREAPTGRRRLDTPAVAPIHSLTANANALADGAVFDREDELAAAIARLAEIDAAIDEQVLADQGELAAA